MTYLILWGKQMNIMPICNRNLMGSSYFLFAAKGRSMLQGILFLTYCLTMLMTLLIRIESGILASRTSENSWPTTTVSLQSQRQHYCAMQSEDTSADQLILRFFVNFWILLNSVRTRHMQQNCRRLKQKSIYQQKGKTIKRQKRRGETLQLKKANKDGTI